MMRRKFLRRYEGVSAAGESCSPPDSPDSCRRQVSRLGLPVASVPADVLMLPGYFGFYTSLVAMSLPASNVITRQTLGWEPVHPNLLADLDNGHYFSGQLTA